MPGPDQNKTQEATAPNYTSDNVELVQHDYNQIMIRDANDISEVDDHLCGSIFATLCCCVCIGIFAIIRSSECRSAKQAGDYVKAKHKSKETCDLIMGSVAVGIFLSLLGAGLQVLAWKMNWYAQQNQYP